MSKHYVLYDVERRVFCGGGDPIHFNTIADAEAHADRLRGLEAYRPEPREYDVVGVRAP